MIRLFLVLMILATQANAELRFEPRALPTDHIYSGGWEHFVGGGVAVFDCDADRFPDMFIAGGEGPARLFRNTTKEIGATLQFETQPIMEITSVTGAYPVDIDNDGLQDLFVLRVGQNMVLKGEPDCQFSDVTDSLGLPQEDRWSTAFSATWEAGQDRPTMAVGNYVDRSDPEGPFEACDSNILHRPDGERYASQDLSPGHCALSMLFSSWNRSGVQDLRVSNDRHYYVRGGAEQMWAMPDLTLRDGEGWNPISIWGMGIASQDITGDGRPEVVLTSMGDQLMQIAGENGYQMARFEIGTFAQRPYIGDDGRPSTGWHAQFGDVDNDGRSDLFIAKGNVDQMPGNAMKDPNNLLIQLDTGRFLEKGDVAGIASTDRSRGAGLVDFNRDGLLDLVVVNRRAPVELYQNTTPTDRAWIQLQPRQSGSNLFAVGAWVEVKQGDRIQTQEVTIGGGHVSGQSGPLHFGLGNMTAAQAHPEVRVIWPDGDIGEWQSVRPSQMVEIWKNGALVADR